MRFIRSRFVRLVAVVVWLAAATVFIVGHPALAEPQPNLVVELFTYDGGPITPDEAFGEQLTLHIRNIGNAPAPRGYTIGLFVTGIPQHAVGTPLVDGTTSGPALQPGQSAVISLPLRARLPDGFPDGTTFLVVRLDTENELDESDTSDNWATIRIVVLWPDNPFIWLVTTTVDEMEVGSLRYGLTYARADDSIVFSFHDLKPTNGEVLITLTSPLPHVTQGNLTIANATTAILDGSNLPAGAPGLVLASDGNRAGGLRIRNMPDSGLVILGNSNSVQITPFEDGPAFWPESIVHNNGAHGIEIQGDENVVQGIVIQDNGGHGVYLHNGAQNNRIGGHKDSDEANLMNGNGGAGVRLQGANTNQNQIQGNVIKGNSAAGVVFAGGAQDNVLGGHYMAKGNLITLNSALGVRITDADTAGNRVEGNQITNNAGTGVSLEDGAENNIVGGDHPTKRNYIIGNEGPGVRLTYHETHGNEVETNHISDNAGAGVLLDGGAHDNWIGGANRRGNTIQDNRSHGVEIDQAHDNRLIKNIIQINAPHGVYLHNGSTGNLLTENIVRANQHDGVHVAGSSSLGNTFSENSIYENERLGIRNVNGGNLERDPPEVTSVESLGDGLWRIRGVTCADCIVEVFTDDGRQGRVFQGSAPANDSGAFTVSNLERHADYFALTATDPIGNTSEFGATDDLTITAIEVTQAIQSLDNAVPLIADKDTVVRVHVRSTVSDVPKVPARLEGTGELGALGALTPTGSGCELQITVRPEPDRGKVDHSFCFYLPPAWVQEGSLELTAVINPDESVPETDFDNNATSTTVAFVAGPSLDVRLYRVGYMEGMVRRGTFYGGFQAGDGIAGGDVNGNGRDEILIAHADTGTVDVFSNPSGNSFEQLTSFNGNFAQGDGIAVGRVDHPFQAKVVIARTDPGVISIYQWAGATLQFQTGFNAGFKMDDKLAVGAVRPNEFPVGNVEDIVIASPDTGEVKIWQWDGAGWFLSESFDANFKKDDALALGRVLDGDGLAQILTAHHGSGELVVWHWNSGTFEKFKTLSTTFLNNAITKGMGFAAGDMDQRPTQWGMLDEIVIAHEDENCACVSVLRSVHDPLAGVPRSRSDGFSNDDYIFEQFDGFIVADTNGDGRAEAIIAHVVDRNGDDDDEDDKWDIEVFHKRVPDVWRYLSTPTLHTDHTISYLRRAYPFATINVQLDFMNFPTWQLATPSSKEVNSLLVEYGVNNGDFTADGTNVAGDVRYYAMVLDEGGFMRGSSMGNRKPASGPTGCTDLSDPFCDDVLVSKYSWDPDGIYGDWYAAHEIGHSIGRPHAPFCNAKGTAPYPYPEGIIGGPEGDEDRFYGFDVGDGSLGLPLQVYPGSEWYDFMSYCSNQWISDFTYMAIRDQIADEQDVLAFQSIAQRGPGLFFAGQLNITRDRGRIFTMFTRDEAAPTHVPDSGDMVVQLESARGGVLEQYFIHAHDDTDPEPGDDMVIEFSGVVPWRADTARVSFWHEGSEVAARTVSANPPTVSLTYPRGGEVLGEEVTLRWSGHDPDPEDGLSYTVLYSADGGANWQTLVTMWPEETLTVDTSQLRGSATGRFRVIASDGVLTAQDESDGDVSLPVKPPRVEIYAPFDGDRFIRGQTLILRGRTTALDGRLKRDGTYQWTSDLDGVLGTGQEVMPNLSVGEHIITLSYSDGRSLAAESRIELSVEDDSPAPSPILCQVLDFDRTGVISMMDVLHAAAHWGLQSTDQNWNAAFDLDGDGEISVADLMLITERWREVCP